MADIIFRSTGLISSNSFTVGTGAVQVSGGPSSAWPLTGVAASYFPSYHRALVRIVNNNQDSAILSIGSTSSVTGTTGFFKQLLAGQMVEINSSGSVPIWIVSSAAGTNVTVEELA